MIAIIDYGMGNLHSLEKALVKVGGKVVITDDKNEIQRAEKVILPGVGAFRDAIALLREKGLDEAAIASANNKKPLMGICLGMQLLFEKSYEYGEHKGLGLLKGEIEHFDCDLKVPHMGWNTIKVIKPCGLLKGIDGAHVYFVHSYCAKDVSDEHVAGITNYAIDFTCAVSTDNIMGTQFHPEKSGEAGLSILENFVRM